VATPPEQEFAMNYASEHHRFLETWMGILSFSKTISDPTLWSLYADKHSGVAFEVQHPWNDDHIIKMEYPPERPVLDFVRLRSIHDKNERDKYLLSLLKRTCSTGLLSHIIGDQPVYTRFRNANFQLHHGKIHASIIARVYAGLQNDDEP
jgi:hypothetical protein